MSGGGEVGVGKLSGKVEAVDVMPVVRNKGRAEGRSGESKRRGPVGLVEVWAEGKEGETYHV